MADSSASAGEIMALVITLGAHLHDVEPEIVGGALADLTAIWLAGHYHPDGPERTAALRKGILAFQMKMIETLIEPNEKIGLERLREGSH